MESLKGPFLDNQFCVLEFAPDTLGGVRVYKSHLYSRKPPRVTLCYQVYSIWAQKRLFLRDMSRKIALGCNSNVHARHVHTHPPLAGTWI